MPLFDRLLDTAALTPHGFCLAWDPVLLWVHAASDAVIALAYFSIPLALLRFVRRRRDLAFRWVFALFAAFIFGCGATHVMGVVGLWVPLYWLDGTIMAGTALVSAVTAASLWPLLPRALALPSPRQLHEANAALMREILERDLLAARLRESEARFRAIVEHATDLIAVLAPAAEGGTRFEAVNPAFSLLSGAPAAALAGRHPRAALPGEAGARIEALAGEAAVLGAPLREELELPDAAGRARQFEAALVPLPGGPADGAPRLLLTLHDVTERRALQAKLMHAQKIEALGRLTGGVAHDFNNILMGVSAALQRLRKDGALDDRRAALADAALQTVQRGRRLVRHMLAFARRQTLEPDLIDVNALVAALAEEVLAGTMGGTVRVETALAPDLWPVLADRGQLEAALLNLAVNARDAMPEGGTLRFETANLPGRQGGPLAGDGVVVRVSDTGRGMAPEVAAQAFDPFFTTKPVGQGTGLGLSQVHGFAHQSGGTAEIRSAPDAGTTVTLTLPRALPMPRA